MKICRQNKKELSEKIKRMTKGEAELEVRHKMSLGYKTDSNIYLLITDLHRKLSVSTIKYFNAEFDSLVLRVQETRDFYKILSNVEIYEEINEIADTSIETIGILKKARETIVLEDMLGEHYPIKYSRINIENSIGLVVLGLVTAGKAIVERIFQDGPIPNKLSVSKSRKTWVCQVKCVS